MTLSHRLRRRIISCALAATFAASLSAQEPKADDKQATPLSPVVTRRYTWAEVETAIQSVRVARTNNPQLRAAMSEWYNLIADPAFTESTEVPEHFVKLGVWTKSRPDSPIPLIAQATALVNQAWHLRGNGFSSTAPADSQKSFRSNLAEARLLLEQAIKLGVKDGEAHARLIDIARAEGRSLDETRSILNAGRAIDPACGELYSAMAEYLLPRWHGKLGDVEKFAAEAVQMLPGDDGLDVYGHIAYVVNQYDANVLFWGDYDRQLLVQAAEVLVKRYPTARNVVPFAALCTVAAQDQAAARRIRPYVTSTDAPRVKVWRNVAADFFRWCEADEVASGQCIWLWGTPLNYGNVSFTADSRAIWCPSGLGRAAATLVDVEKRSVVKALSGTNSPLFDIALDPAQNCLVGAFSGESFQGWVRWNLSAAAPALRHPTSEGCQAIVVDPKGERVAWAEAKTVRTFDLAAGKEGPPIDLVKTVERLKFSADGKRLAVSAGSISVWDVATGTKRYNLPGFDTQPREKIACEHLLDIDSEGRIWATTFVFGAKPVQRPLVRFAADGKKWDTILPHLNGLPRSAVLSPDRRLLAIAENNNDPGGPESIQVWDLTSRHMKTRLAGHHNHIASLAFSPDGKRLASVGYLGGPVKIWLLDHSASQPGGGQVKKGTPL